MFGRKIYLYPTIPHSNIGSPTWSADWPSGMLDWILALTTILRNRPTFPSQTHPPNPHLDHHCEQDLVFFFYEISSGRHHHHQFKLIA